MVDRDVNSVANIINFALFVVNSKLTTKLKQINFYAGIETYQPEGFCFLNREFR
jgi:hypothetical protein